MPRDNPRARGAGGFLKRKVGPVPVWAIALVLAGVIGFLVWRSRRSSAAASSDTGAAAGGSLFPSASGGGSSGGGGFLGFPPQGTPGGSGGTAPPGAQGSGAEPSAEDQALFQQLTGVTFQQSAYYWANYGGGQSALASFYTKFKKEHPNMDPATLDRLYQGLLYYVNNPTVAGGDTGTVGTSTSSAGPIPSETMGEFSPAAPSSPAPTLVGATNVGDFINTTFDTGEGQPVGAGGIAPAGSWQPAGPPQPAALPPNLALDTQTPPVAPGQGGFGGNPNVLGPGAVL